MMLVAALKTDETMLDAALKYVAEGYSIFPCGIDKKPLVSGGFKSASNDPDQTRAWWTQFPNASIGFPTGRINGIVAVDVDRPAGPDSLSALEAELGPLPATQKQRTGSGGWHILFTWEEGVFNSASKLAENVDVRGEGGYIIVCPSGHESGKNYVDISDGPLAILPEEWRVRMTNGKVPMAVDQGSHRSMDHRSIPSGGTSAYGRKALEAEAHRVAHTPEGERNDTLNSAAFSLGQLVAGEELDRHEAETDLLDAALSAGLPEGEACRTIASGMTGGVLKPRKAPESQSSILKPEVDIPQEEAIDEWTLARTLFPRVAFPWEVLPEAMAESFKQLGRSCATSATTLPAQAFCLIAAGVGRKVDVQAKGSWRESLIFWSGDIRGSGAGKTGTMTKLAEVLNNLQDVEDKRFKAELDAWGRMEPKDRQGQTSPRKPRGYFTTDLTLEGIHADLDGHPSGGIVVVLNELSAFIGGQNQYKSGGTDRESWLSLHDGKSARIARAKGAVFIKGARVQVCGGIQPGIFRHVFGGEGGRYLEDGTVFRCLFTYEPLCHHDLTAEVWTEENTRAWEDTMTNAISWADQQQETWSLVLSPEASARFYDWRNELNVRLPELPQRFGGFLPKAYGYALRLAGALHLLERFSTGQTPDATLSLNDMERGIKTASFYMGQAVDALKLLVCEGENKAPVEVSERSTLLARVLEGLRGDVDNGRLAVGYIQETFNRTAKPEERMNTARALGAMLRSCGLNVSSTKHDANGKRRVYCLPWDAQTESFIKQNHQGLHCLQTGNIQPVKDGDIAQRDVSEVSPAGGLETSETSKKQSLQTEAPTAVWFGRLRKLWRRCRARKTA